jgi:hypothetical protein
MKKKSGFLDSLEKKDKKISLAIVLTFFGILLFIALALTLPWSN